MLKGKFRLIGLAALPLLALVGCGGGGGGSGPSLSYTGVATQANLDSTSTTDIGTGVLSSSSGTGSLPLAVSTQSSADYKQAVDALAQLALANVRGAVGNSSGSRLTGVTQSGTGNCGGTATITDQSTVGSVNVSMSFSGFCTDDSVGNRVVFNGSLSATGTYTGSSSSPVFTSLTLSMPYFSVAATTNGITTTAVFAGSIDFAFDSAGLPTGFTLTAVFSDGARTFKAVNYNFDESTGMVSGRFYHPNHGYVDVSTLVAFSLTGTGQYCGGTLEFTGANGTATFEADNTCANYQVCVTPAPSGPTTCGIWTTWPQ